MSTSIIRVTSVECPVEVVNVTAKQIATLLNAERQTPKAQAEKCAELFDNINANAMEMVSAGLLKATERKDGTREVKQGAINDYVTTLFRGYLTGKSAKKYADVFNALHGEYPDLWDSLTLGKLTILSRFECKSFKENHSRGLHEYLVWLGDQSQRDVREKWLAWHDEHMEKLAFQSYLTEHGTDEQRKAVEKSIAELERNEPEKPVSPEEPTFADTMEELALYLLDCISDSEVRKTINIYLEEIGEKKPDTDGTDGNTDGTDGNADGTDGTEPPKPKTPAELKADALNALTAYMETLEKIPVFFKKSVEELSR